MEYVSQNLIVILTAASAGLLVSLLHMTLSKPDTALRVSFLAFAAFAQFWLAAVLAGALLLVAETDRSWTEMIVSVFTIWIGLIVPPLMTTLRFRDAGGPMVAADSLHWLVVLMVQGSIMQFFGLLPWR